MSIASTNIAVRSLSRLPNAEQETPLQQVIDHGDLRSHRRGMRVRQVHGTAAELDPLGRVDQARNKRKARGDGLRTVGHVLADESLGIPQPVREHDRLAVFLEGFGVVARWRMQRHREIAELHRALLAPISRFLSFDKVEGQPRPLDRRPAALAPSHPAIFP
jgi:hypothetical protein